MQVRLDDDTAAFVAERKARDGGSLSKAANAIIRDWAGPLAGLTVTAVTSIGAGGSGGSGRSTKCSHPLLRRVGNQCAACGSTLP